jgi:GDP-4-dehydro-6-deoxy-D-mannose reductase
MDESSMSKRILITGAQGFIGRYTVAQFLRSGVRDVLGIGRSAPMPNLFTHNVLRDRVEQPALLTRELAEALADPSFRYEQANIMDKAAMARIVADFRPDCVVHLASTRREEHVDRLIRGNVLGVRSLVEACGNGRACVRRIVLGSSGGVYGVPCAEALPLRESGICVPADPYAISKLAGEHLARVLCERSGIELVIGRIFNVVGPAQDERHVCGRLASQVAAIRKGVQPHVISVTGLSATRDYIDVRDVASALRLLAECGVPSEVYNIASGVESSVRAVLDFLCEFAGLRGHVEINQSPVGGDTSRHVGSIEKLRAIGFRCGFDLAASLHGVLDYYLAPNSSGIARSGPRLIEEFVSL